MKGSQLIGLKTWIPSSPDVVLGKHRKLAGMVGNLVCNLLLNFSNYQGSTELTIWCNNQSENQNKVLRHRIKYEEVEMDSASILSGSYLSNLSSFHLKLANYLCPRQLSFMYFLYTHSTFKRFPLVTTRPITFSPGQICSNPSMCKNGTVLSVNCNSQELLFQRIEVPIWMF